MTLARSNCSYAVSPAIRLFCTEDVPWLRYLFILIVDHLSLLLYTIQILFRETCAEYELYDVKSNRKVSPLHHERVRTDGPLLNTYNKIQYIYYPLKFPPYY